MLLTQVTQQNKKGRMALFVCLPQQLQPETRQSLAQVFRGILQLCGDLCGILHCRRIGFGHLRDVFDIACNFMAGVALFSSGDGDVADRVLAYNGPERAMTFSYCTGA